MSDKIFSIPFRSRSLKSDYSCGDGELESIENAVICSSKASEIMADSTPFEYPEIVRDCKKEFPPLPEIEFSLRQDILPGWHIHPSMFPSKIMENSGNTEESWGKAATRVLDGLRDEAAKENLFCLPFLVIAAWRIDGGIDGRIDGPVSKVSHIMPVPPVLMIPNSSVPLITGNGDFEASHMEMSVKWALCRLCFRFDKKEELRSWADRVKALDIMVSRPLELYSDSGDMRFQKGVTTDCFTHSEEWDSGLNRERRLTDASFPFGWKPRAKGSLLRDVLSLDNFYTVSSIPFDRLTQMNDFQEVDFTNGSLSDIYSKEPYRPDYAHLSEITAEGKIFEAGRENLWNLTLKSPAILPLSRLAAFSSENYRPRWIFHPYPNIEECHSLQMERHPVFYGSYYWGGLQSVSDILPEESGPEEGRVLSRLPDYVWRSEKGIGLLFPDSLLMTPETGEIRALVRAFRSSGLVATTVPTFYAFTDKGIFLLKETDGGILKDSGLVTVARLGNINSLMIQGSRLYFRDEEGIGHYIEGTKVKKIEAGIGESGGEEIQLKGMDLSLKFETRPLKLGEAEHLKKLREIKLRGHFQRIRCELRLYGSRNLNDWFLIARCEGSAILGCPDVYFRFFKVAGEVYLPSDRILEGLSIEMR